MRVLSNGPRRRVLIGALAAGSVLALSACGSSSESDDSDGITLHVLGPNSTQKLAADLPPEEQEKIQQQVIDGFLDEHPEVKDVVWDAEGDRENSTQRLISANLSDEPLDLIACDANGTNSSYVRNGALKPFSDDFIDTIRDRFRGGTLEDYVVDDGQYGVPLSAVSITTMFYNVDLFKEKGIEPPASYDDLVAASQRLEKDGITPVLFQGSNAGLWSIWYTEALAQTQEDPVAKALSNLDGDTRFDDDSDVEAFALIEEWVEDGVLPQDVLGMDVESVLADFAAGRAAMIYDGTFRVAQLKEAVTDFTWGALAFPQMTDSYDARHGGGPDRGICLSQKIPDSHLDAAEAFVEYLTQPDVADAYLSPLSPIESSLKGVSVSDEDFAVQLRESVYPNRIRYLDWIWPSELTAVINSSLQGLVGGDLSPEEAAAEVQAGYDDLVDAGKWPPAGS